MKFRRLVRAWIERDAEAAGIREEMDLHRELRARKLREQGVDVEEAGFEARRKFGNAALYRDQISDLWGWNMWERLLQDLRYGARALAKAPGFTAVAVLTLALGLGINTAIFSAVNAVMLRPLPYPDSNRLISLWEEKIKPPLAGTGAFSSTGAQVGTGGPAGRTTVSVANIPDYKKAGVFEDLASYDLAPLNLTGIGTPERITGEAVTWNFFAVLGIQPERGRSFLPAEDHEGADLVAIVTDGFWQRRLNGSPDAVGESIQLDGKRYRVIGILPAGFQSPLQLGLKSQVEVYTPASYPAALLPARGDHEVNVVGRLKPGVSVESARAALAATSAQLSRAFPPTNQWIRAAIAPLRDDLAGNVRTALLALLGASGLIVLIACVNVANLFMVRAAGRRHESSVRVALGSGRIGLIRQLMTESLLIAGAGALTGVGLGVAFMKGLTSIAPPGIPRIENASLDWRVFLIAWLLALATALLFGIAPAWQASQAKPVDALKTARSGGGAVQARWRTGLTVAEVALSLMLIVGAGLLLRSFSTLMGVDLGFQTDHVIAMNVNLPAARYANGEARFRFYDQLEQRLRALGGVRSVAYANRMPMRGGWSSGIALDGDANQLAQPDFQAVNGGYFETLGIPLLRGRGFSAQDSPVTLPVAIVNLAFARQLLAGADPIGHFMQRGPTAPKITIVGVVNDIRRAGKSGDIKPEVYLDAAQTPLYPVALADLAVRTAGDPHSMVNTISSEIWAIDKDQPVTNVHTLDEIVDDSVAQRRFQTLLLAIFAGVAVLLAVIGIYGVLAYSVSQRSGELGIRVALGASPAAILRLVLREAGILIAAGIAIGVSGSLGLTRFLAELLFEIKPTDWRAYVAAVVLLAAVGLIAALLPARRGAKVDPMVALRQD